ncbi:hypothetical protein AAG906_033608 [Vitis piasezkii]
MNDLSSSFAADGTTPLPKEVNGDQATRSFAELIEIGIKGAQCPLGTVIIRRTRKEDLIWARQHSKAYYPDNTANPNVVAATNGSFHGAAGEININKATVKPTQFSEAVIWVQHRSPQTGMNSIQSGWAVSKSNAIQGRSKQAGFAVDCKHL